jgi:hypothetical protein
MSETRSLLEAAVLVNKITAFPIARRDIPAMIARPPDHNHPSAPVVEKEDMAPQNTQLVLDAVARLEETLSALKGRDKESVTRGWLSDARPVIMGGIMSGLIALVLFVGSMKVEIDEHARRISVLENGQVVLLGQLSDVRATVSGIAGKQELGLKSIDRILEQLSVLNQNHHMNKMEPP